MASNMVETLVGAFVIVVAGAFLFFAYTTSDVADVAGYKVSADFDSVDGLTVGSDVRVSGIKVGTVTSQELDPNTYLARVSMAIDPKVQLPDDSSIKITSEGLLGGNYLAIEPGGSEDLIADGGKIQFTQGSIDLIGLVGQAIFSAGGSSEEETGQ